MKRYKMMFKNKPLANSEKKEGGYVFEIRDLVQDEPVVPQFCCKTVEGAKRNFAIFLSQNKMKPSDFRLNIIGKYNSDLPKMVCNGSQVFISDYMRDDFEQTEVQNKEE